MQRDKQALALTLVEVLTTGANAPTGTRSMKVTTTTGAATLDEMHAMTSHRIESTAAGEDAQHTKSTRMKRLPTRKSSHAGHYASREPYVRCECQTGSN